MCIGSEFGSAFTNFIVPINFLTDSNIFIISVKAKVMKYQKRVII